MVTKKHDVCTVGRRKESVARAYFYSGKGQIVVNGKNLDDYFSRETSKMILKQPLQLTETTSKYDIVVNVNGGGQNGQAGAIRLAIARGLQTINTDLRSVLKKAGMLTRDSRVVERKKYGQPGARKKFQFSKDRHMNKKITVEELLESGAHFGHPTSRWDPNYLPYIATKKNGIHIINLNETINCIEKVKAELLKLVQSNGNILFVGTKNQVKDVVSDAADKCGMFYIIERWLGGILTNFTTIKKSIKRLEKLEKESSAIYKNLTKKERSQLERERIKLSDLHRGIKDMKHLPDALFVVDIKNEKIAVDEAKILGIPVFGIVDSNTNPKLIDYPIPANDDSIKTVKLILNYLVESINVNNTDSTDPKDSSSEEGGD